MEEEGNSNKNGLTKTVNEIIGLLQENLKLRTFFDFAMDSLLTILPDDWREPVAEFGKKAIDEIIYNIW